MKLEVGMYVRTNDGYINKIKKVNQFNVLVDGRDLFGEELNIPNNEITKASYNIIDILEKGDIISYSVGKHEILLIDDELMVRNTGLIYDNNYYLPIKSITIKSVITHEQMEQMAYKVSD